MLVLYEVACFFLVCFLSSIVSQDTHKAVWLSHANGSLRYWMTLGIEQQNNRNQQTRELISTQNA